MSDEKSLVKLLQKSLLVGTANGAVRKASGSGNSPRGDLDVHESEFLNDTDPIGEHIYSIIYELHTIQNSIVAPVLPTLELKLKSPSERDRKRSFRLLARLFSEPFSSSPDNSTDHCCLLKYKSTYELEW
ncbi:hypothetical protein X801_05641 [Opisthorchis viverrini]|uniref:Uncharacterized protein n=1 Tax=Opisthorchis viverrini TaxID=6198 RepID=A0A1S8WVY1_OPIVI|nr:hypothetical protein X801_05641 [Opisthorchis viverrini]